MSSSCIHVTALLFRIEAANRNGITNPACTSKQCVWNVPAEKTVIKPARIADLDWKSAKLNKEPSRPTVDSRRSLFQPVEKKRALNDNERRRMFYNNLKDTFPDSCFVMMSNAEYTQEPLRPVATPKDSTILTSTEIDDIEKATVGQAENEVWHKQREGRITASNFYKVFTKVETMKASDENSVSAKKLVDSLLGRTKPPENLPALKYGRDMEVVAKQEFLKYFEKHHKDTSYRECGIFIDKSKQYLGASPDLLVKCSCCGKAVVEIKCPYSIVYETPTPDNLSYLCTNNGHVTLKQKHQYFAQVQGEMATTKRHLCHFFVYTQKGYHVETIGFDATYWCKVEENLTWFYNNYLAPALKLL